MAYFEGLCWSFAYYTVGTNPIATTEDSELAKKKKQRGKGKQKGVDSAQPKTLYAAWDWSYPYYYAPLIRDLVRCCRETSTHDALVPGVIRELAQGLSVRKGPVPPLVMLLSVLPPERLKTTFCLKS